jgi:hypothetical protein
MPPPNAATPKPRTREKRQHRNGSYWLLLLAGAIDHALTVFEM